MFWLRPSKKPGNPAVGKDVGEVVGLPGKNIKIAGSLAEVLPPGDVLIDFTHPEISLEHLKQAAPAGKAVVIGTTGFSAAQIDEIKDLAQKRPGGAGPEHERRRQSDVQSGG